MVSKTATDLFHLHFLDAPLIRVYVQVTVVLSIGYVLRRLQFKDINFEVHASAPDRGEKA